MCIIMRYLLVFRQRLVFLPKKGSIMHQQLGEVVKERRSSLHLTQEDLADMAGVAVRTLKAIEVGKGNPSLSTLQKLAEVLGMEIRLEIKKLNK